MTEPTARTAPSRTGFTFGANDHDALGRLLADMPVAHVAFVQGEQPYVLPVAAAADDGDVLLHGSTGSRWLRLVATGIPVSVGISALDGIVVARSAFESSMRYRSAVLFGRCHPVPDQNRRAALDLLTDALIPGRTAEVRRPTDRELAATLVLRMTVEEWSLKVSDGWPDDPIDDVAGPAWAGVVLRRTRYATAEPAADMHPGIAMPPSVRRLLGRLR